MTNKPNLSIEEVARYFDVTPKTVYRLAQRGELPGFKIGGQWRFSLPLLERWVADRVMVAGRKAQGTPPTGTSTTSYDGLQGAHEDRG